MIKQVVTTLKMTPVVEAVSIPFVHQLVDDEEGLVPNDVVTGSATAVLDELVRVAEALRPLRSTAMT